MEEHRLALPSGYRIENYEIQGVLGKGGFGITYVAYDWTLGRHMAIKELLPDSIATRIEGSTVVAMGPSHEESWQWARDRFIEEARILAGFRHLNIIAVHRLIEANGTVYLVMDHLEGESYEARLRRIGREPAQASLMRVIGPLLDGLQEVHAANLLHRDIKPENILFDKRGNPILIDFGAARATVGATMTMTSIVTHGYSPIEQYQTKGRMGPWTDIYALGAVMCRAITGEKPPVAADRSMDDDFSWLSHRAHTGFDQKLLVAVDWALRVRSEERPQKIQDWEPHLRARQARVEVPSSVPVVEPVPHLNRQREASFVVPSSITLPSFFAGRSVSFPSKDFWIEFIPFRRNSTEVDGIWSFAGRIGRRQYFSRLVTMNFTAIAVWIAMVIFVGLVSPDSSDDFSSFFAIIFPAIWCFSTIKRLHDFGSTGWGSLFTFVPFIGSLMLLCLVFIPGQEKSNAYGSTLNSR